MARYISKARAYKRGVVYPRLEMVKGTDGQVMQIESGDTIIASFHQGGATEREVQIALERFSFKGTTDGEDPTRRLSIYDTDEEARQRGWSDDLKKRVESILDNNQDEYYFKVEAVKAQKPWPSYDDTDINHIVDVAKVVGVSLEDILAYEDENSKRPEVVSAVQAALKPDEDTIEVFS